MFLIGLPLFLFPSGAQVSAVLVLSYFSLLRMWANVFPSYLFDTVFILLISVLLCSSLLLMVFGQCTFNILLRHLF